MISAEEALARFLRSTESFLARMDAVADERWSIRPDGEEWSAAETVEHVATTNGATLHRLRRAVIGGRMHRSRAASTSPIGPGLDPGRRSRRRRRAAIVATSLSLLCGVGPPESGTPGSLVAAASAAQILRGETTRVSVSFRGGAPTAASFSPSLSGDARFVAFESFARNLLPTTTANDRKQVFLLDRRSGEIALTSASATGEAGDEFSEGAALSANGRWLAFFSYAGNLVEGDARRCVRDFDSADVSCGDVFVFDRLRHRLERASVAADGTEANDHSLFPALSADGRFVAFLSEADNLVAGDANRAADVFVRDRLRRETIRVSAAVTDPASLGVSGTPSISPNGRVVAFEAFALDGPIGSIYVHDRRTGETRPVSVSSSGEPGNDTSSEPTLSRDGRVVAFQSFASNLVPDDRNGHADVFVHDRRTGRTQRVSVAADGGEPDGPSFQPSISADGRFVAFASFATNLVADDENGAIDVFLRDLRTGRTALASVSSADAPANGDSQSPSISADGRAVAFISLASNLAPEIPRNPVADDVYLRAPALGPGPQPRCRLGGRGGAGPRGGVWIGSRCSGVGRLDPGGLGGTAPADRASSRSAPPRQALKP